MNTSTAISDISKYIDDNSLCNNKNLLECICLLCTGKELINGVYDYFIQQIVPTIQNSKSDILEKICFKIIVSDKNQNRPDCSLLRQFFPVDIIEMSIPDIYDCYDNKDPDCIYGSFSGPNYTFFQAINILKKYNTTLFLECDCFFIDGWLEATYNYVKHSGGFWISGGLYDGLQDLNSKKNDLINCHINGGVCLYKTGDVNFQNFVLFCKILLPNYLKHIDFSLPYDYLMKCVIDYHFDNKLDQRELWKFIRRQYIHNNIISNLSSKKDMDIDSVAFFKKYGNLIIHKKPKELERHFSKPN